MTVQYGITKWLRGGENYDVSYKLLGQSSNVAVTVPPSGSFWPGNPRGGAIRVVQSAQGTGGQTKIGTITASDGGSNVANIYKGDSHYSSANAYIDQTFPFFFEWEVASINLNLWTFNGNTSTYDIEVAGFR